MLDWANLLDRYFIFYVQVRFLARSFGVPGDHHGQQSNGFRWPYGPVAIIAPFNFPLEIPVLQLMGALFMGNRVTLKVRALHCCLDHHHVRSRVSLGALVCDQPVRFDPLFEVNLPYCPLCPGDLGS